MKNEAPDKELPTTLDVEALYVGASRPVVHAVLNLMRDRKGRTDEEIFEFLYVVGILRTTQDTVRHARLALSNAGWLRRGGRRKTLDGGTARVWRR